MALTDPDEARKLIRQIVDQPKKVIFGIDRPLEYCVMALVTPLLRDGPRGKEFSQAHVYLLDKPGRGKTAAFTYISAAVRAKFSQVAGTADILPKEFIGEEKVDRATGIRTLYKGPIHSNIFFYDEITRTPPLGQSSLLGAMDGARVQMFVTNKRKKIIETKEFPLYPISDNPNEKRLYFIVFATANPIEFEGTFPISEAQKDRFTYSYRMGLPPREDEKRIRAKNVINQRVEEVTDLATLLDISKMVNEVELSEQAHEYIMRIIVNSRPFSQDLEDYGFPQKRHANPNLLGFIDQYVAMGCSPRRNFHLEAAAKAWAWMMKGKDRHASVDDVKAILPITLEHILLLTPYSIGDDVSAKKVVERIIAETEVP
ncbi:MAG: hypothetical protein COV30_02215 [Candidatus Yanofskybacteria bacterium CG10_big_fil_rev_8_21_14_0_10_37_15]|uniref:ATPase AAA-3 domain-containing protein n=1 Tax=Candidatus Yanofskybacteria bacterium CG10_big_fil_rev_8_21_14_0_10_37_15 TaxID=1975097 RepID=A0A2H0R5B7_9BACT|nr:MAG: hypothetical protein COV30_02215 [Candidatus Yanofskybacteria bacterium CG10_big_fil_rev_8_21_14_0_10_37_15]